MYGLIAQDLEESLTEVGIEKTALGCYNTNLKMMKNNQIILDYTKLIPILIIQFKNYQQK